MASACPSRIKTEMNNCKDEPPPPSREDAFRAISMMPPFPLDDDSLIALLEWMQEAEKAGRPFPSFHFCDLAAYAGSLKALQWARGKGYPWTNLTCALAASGGHIEVLQWARDHACPWRDSACEDAFCAEQWETMQWLVDNGAPCPEWIFEAAIRLGHPLKRLAVVKGE